MDSSAYQKVLDCVSEQAEPLSGLTTQYDTLIDRIGDARFVLLGEATHGTKEFYEARIEISKRLILEKGFMAIAIEGDWPDAYQIHRYIQGISHKKDWQLALNTFKRFPSWMWRNKTMPGFLQWLYSFNKERSLSTYKIGFYGLDLYSLHTSIEVVTSYLDKMDKNAADAARRRYACFEHMEKDPQNYGYLTNKKLRNSCLEACVQQTLEMHHHALEYIRKDTQHPSDDNFFYASQNARLIKNAEHYYRAMFEDHVSSWNIRDTHMAETVSVLADHLENQFKKPAKIIIWAHNSHVGDARATEIGTRGEINIGQLIREQHDNSSYSVGFSTYEGSVTAANEWDSPSERKTITPGIEGSYENLFHQLPYKNFILTLRDNKILDHYLKLPRLQRAIGVVYRPETERTSHYFFTRLPYQFDSLLHFDITNAVEPLN